MFSFMVTGIDPGWSKQMYVEDKFVNTPENVGTNIESQEYCVQ